MKSLSAAAWLALALITPACSLGVMERPARDAEAPLPLPEIRTTAPAPGMVWASGAWHWNGVEHVWVPGRWEAPLPVPGA